MTESLSPVVRRRRLAAELRQLRSAAGLTLEAAAEHLECSVAKVSRLEGGQVGARVQDVRDLLELYGAGPTRREALLQLVRQARGRGWWRQYGDVISEPMQELIGLEDEATRIYTYANHLVPGLLQTTAYARAVMETWRDLSAEVIERGVELRMRRQAVLSREPGPSYWTVIDEGVLRRPAGGSGVMEEQYGHLIALADSQAITLQVLPFTAGADAGGSVPFVILEFADLAEPRVVHTGLLTESVNINAAEKVGRYIAQFNSLREHAMDPVDSVDFIRRLRTDGGVGWPSPSTVPRGWSGPRDTDGRFAP
jgi:transcriptional regulator with XRE-family HTH domain